MKAAQKEANMITAVLPTALTVSDMQRSLAFYRDLLGFEVGGELPSAAERERWDRYHVQVCGIQNARINVVYLIAADGKSELELIEYASPKQSAPERPALSQPGSSIVALAVQDSREAVHRLRAAGVEVLSDPIYYRTDEGEESFTTYLYDPDGNALCLFEVLPKETAS
jgi:catechol 2,3-dioxygenase-like lactoylglutathione lyase family enzyme